MLDFVDGLLQVDPRCRYSADASLQHGFFQAQLVDSHPPTTVVSDLAIQIYNPNLRRDFNEYLEFQRESAEEAATIPHTVLRDSGDAELQAVRAEEAEDMPDTMLWHPEDAGVQDTRADKILDAAPLAGSVDIRPPSAPTLPQSRRRSSRLSSSSSIHGQHKGRHEHDPSKSGSRRASRQRGKHTTLAVTAETEVPRPTDTRQHDHNNHPTAMELLGMFKRQFGSVVPTGKGDLVRPQEVGSRTVYLHNGLHVIRVHSQKVTMDASDFRLNGSQIFWAAKAGGAPLPSCLSSSSYYRPFQKLQVISKKSRDRSIWLSFQHGCFLIQAVGLESELVALVSCAPKAPPKREKNYLIPRAEHKGDSEGHGAAQSQVRYISRSAV
jgi:hypothetical protein